MVDISDDDDLYRRFVISHLRKDGSLNSSLFKRPPGDSWDSELSFDLARLSTVDQTAKRNGREGFGVVSLTARDPRALGYVVRHDPNPEQEPDNAAHCLVEGETDQEKAWALAEKLVIMLRPTR